MEQFFHTKQIKNKTIDPNGKVPLRGIFYFMLMSTCPDDGDVNWSMSAICDQNDIDRADVQTDEERARYREILDKFESTVLDGQTEETISQFLYEVLDMIKPFFHPDLVELQEIKYTDTYGPIRFLQKIYTNWIQYSRQESSESSLTLIDYVREWKGGNAEEFSKHLRTIQKMKNELPPSDKGIINDQMLH